MNPTEFCFWLKGFLEEGKDRYGFIGEESTTKIYEMLDRTLHMLVYDRLAKDYPNVEYEPPNTKYRTKAFGIVDEINEVK